jgi:threonine/homoserine/homoserine lactone efflux protein
MFASWIWVVLACGAYLVFMYFLSLRSESKAEQPAASVTPIKRESTEEQAKEPKERRAA